MRIDPSAIYKQFNKTNSVDKEVTLKNGQSLPKEGQVVKGRILDANQSGVKVKLSDGQVVQARLGGDFQFSIGEEVSFLVKESTGDLLVLSPDMTTSDQMADKLATILANANLPQTQENQAMLQVLIKNNMPIDSQSLNDMVKLQKQYPEASLKQLIFMTKHQIPISNETINQLSMLENNEHALMKGIASLAQDIATSEGLSQNEQQVLNLITEDQVAIEFLKNTNELIGKLDQAIKLTGQNLELVKGQTGNDISLNNPSATEVTTTIAGKEPALAPTKEAPTLTTTAESSAASIGVEQTTAQFEAADSGNKPISLQNEDKAIVPETLAQTKTTEVVNAELPIKEMMMAKDFEQLASSIGRSTGVSLPDNVSLNDLQLLVDNGLMTNDRLREFLTEVKDQATYHTIAKGMLMSESDLEDVSQVKDYFSKLHDKVTTLIQANGELFSEESPVAKEANNVKGSVEFMNALNQDFNLLHLPMMLGDQLLNSELYIMNDRKALKKDNDTVTALVRLDLLNLGHTDIYVKKTSKNVEVTFYMSDESQIQVMKDSAYKLHTVLRDKGFNSMGIHVAPLTEAFDVTKDFLDEGTSAAEMKRYTFDMRA